MTPFAVCVVNVPVRRSTISSPCLTVVRRTTPTICKGYVTSATGRRHVKRLLGVVVLAYLLTAAGVAFLVWLLSGDIRVSLLVGLQWFRIFTG